MKSAVQKELTIFNDEGKNVKPGLRCQVSGKPWLILLFLRPET